MSELVSQPGVYELPTGQIYVVKATRDKQRYYAKKLVETSHRMTETGEVVDFDFEYEKGAIYQIKPEYLMGIERAKSLMIRYGHCIACGKTLKVAKSVEQGLGPVCVKYFKASA